MCGIALGWGGKKEIHNQIKNNLDSLPLVLSDFNQNIDVTRLVTTNVSYHISRGRTRRETKGG